MIDIDFYLKIAPMKRYVGGGWIPEGQEHDDIFAYLEKARSKKPVVFNIETTNACNMTCPFCPRTTHMTRPVKTMAPDVFARIVEQIEPHPADLWMRWVEHAQETYKVNLFEQSENAFFLYIITRVLVLHGYGDPLLDPHIPGYAAMLTKRGIPSYFSCNPANIQIDRVRRVMDSGLTYLKFSVDSLAEPVRGKDNWLRDYLRIMEALEVKVKHGYSTQVVVTMINTGREEFEKLREKFGGLGAYIYQKSLDQAWMTGGESPQSIHWREFCQIPWSSMTIKSDGMAASCEEDYNNEIILGDAKAETLEAIWNGKKYAAFRHAHVYHDIPHLRCTDGRCDMKTIGSYL